MAITRPTLLMKCPSNAGGSISKVIKLYYLYKTLLSTSSFECLSSGCRAEADIIPEQNNINIETNLEESWDRKGTLMLIRDNGKYDESAIETLILKEIKEKEPKTVKDLVAYLKKKYDLPKRLTLEIVTHMRERGKLMLHKKTIQTSEDPASTPSKPQPFIDYLQSPQATNLWVTLTLVVATIVAALLIPEDLYPAVFLRWILGASFVLFLPGYALKTAIFIQKDLDSAERIAVSFGLSLAVTPLVGLILTFTPWGISLTPVLIFLATITGILMAVGAYRQAKTKKTTA